MRIDTLGIAQIQKLKKLHDKVFNRNLSYIYFDWLFKNPYGVIPLGMFEDNRLIGFYCGELRRFKGHKIAICTIAMIDPDNRKRGLFVRLARELYKRLENIGCDFIMLFANKNIVKIYEKYLDFQPIQLKKYWLEVNHKHFHPTDFIRLFTSQNDYKKYRYFDHPSTFYDMYLDTKTLHYLIVSKYHDQLQLIDYSRFTDRTLEKAIMEGAMKGCKWITSFQTCPGGFWESKMIDTWLCVKNFNEKDATPLILDNLRMGMTDTY